MNFEFGYATENQSSAYLLITDDLVESLECKRVELHQLPKQIKATLKDLLWFQFFTSDVVNEVLQEKIYKFVRKF